MDDTWPFGHIAAGKLKKLGFKPKSSWDGGMHKLYVWSNLELIIYIGYDRGWDECQIGTEGQRTPSFRLLWLLRYMKNDKDFYQKEPDKNGWITISPDENAELFVTHYDEIQKFIKSSDDVIYKQYIGFIKSASTFNNEPYRRQ